MRYLLIIFIFSFFLGCNTSSQKEENLFQEADSSTLQIPSPGATEQASEEGASKKFIRKANLRFAVKNVVQSTYVIEDITRLHNGYVDHTNLTSSTDISETIPVTKDSSIERRYITTVNAFELRIPNTELDSALKEIAQLISHLDHRIIDAEDVSLKILSNNLALKRNEYSRKRIIASINNKGNKVEDMVDAEEIALQKKDVADQSKLSNLHLEDQVEFSTVNLNIYQRQIVLDEMVLNKNIIKPYEASFGQQLLSGLNFGWKIIEELILLVVKSWSIWMLLAVSYMVYKKKHFFVNQKA